MATPLDTAQRRLNAAKERIRRQALGPVLGVDDAALDTLATVSDHDMPEVTAFVSATAGQRGVDMLRAGS